MGSGPTGESIGAYLAYRIKYLAVRMIFWSGLIAAVYATTLD